MKKNLRLTSEKKSPLIVGVLSTKHGLSVLARSKLPCEVVELRLDHLFQDGATFEEIQSALLKKKHPAIVTARHSSEGGVHRWQPGERASLLHKLLPSAEYLDIELSTLREMRILRSQFPKTPLILSAHFFEHTPADDELATLLERMLAKKPDIIKIACRCNSSSDLGRLAVLQYLNRDLPLSLMAMGELGSISRTMLPRLGARLVYGWLDQPTAPGQPSARELRTQIP